MILSGPQQRFAEGIAKGLNATEAYQAAYPKSSKAASRSSAADLLANPNVSAEVERIRREAEKMAGGAVLEIAEVHRFLARVVRCRIAEEPENSDLFVKIKRRQVRGEEGGEIVEYAIPDKLGAIARWCDLKGKGAASSADDAISKLLASIRE